MKRLYLLLALLLSSAAMAQQAWDTNVISWTNPTTCTTGEPIAQCPITAVRVEESATTTGTFRAVATLPTIGSTYTHVGVTAGQHCYRIIVDSGKGPSGPSNVACKTNVKPVGPPNPPTNLVVVDPVAYSVKPDYQHFAFLRGAKYGKAVKGAACDETRVTSDGYYAIERPRSAVTPRPSEGAVFVARCG